ncbi:MAG: gamma-glutamyltransferase family protein [Myxococcota bacterium]
MRRWMPPLGLISVFVLVSWVPACRQSSAEVVAPARPPVGSAPAESPPEVQEAVVADGHAATFARYAVASDHPQASAAAATVMAQGGNAADAVVAGMLALGVVSPASSGLGGGGFALYYDAEDEGVTYLDFRETAPAAARPDMFEASGGGPGGDEAGEAEPAPGLSAGVPGEPLGLETLRKRFGTMERARLTAPAVRLAEDGFQPGERVVSLLARFAEDVRDDAVAAAWLGDDEDAEVAPDATLTNPELAETLRTFADEGAEPFYRGAIARDVVDAVNEAGGRMELSDLAAYEVDERQPLVGEYFDHRWVTVPPESAGGFTVLMALAQLERWQPSDDAPPWTEVMRLHAFAEAMRGPFIDRARYFGDPRFAQVPVADLLAPARVARRADVFDPDGAVEPGRYDLPLTSSSDEGGEVPPERGTSHLCVIDADGNMASVTTTVNWPFGIREAVRGFWVNNELDDFTKELTPGPDAPAWERGGGANRARARRRPVSSMAPTMAFDAANRPALCLGASGGTRIVSSAVQVGYRIVALGQDPGRAVVVPRIHASDEPGVAVEEGFPEALVEGLKTRGHEILPMRYAANVQAIAIDRPLPEVESDARLLRAASDPRKGGRPAGR